MSVWDADFEIDADTAAQVIAAQFPALAPIGLAPLGVGWDNVAFRVNERFVFRFPRRHVAVALIETETRFLPMIAPHLPLPVPVPAFTGVPSEAFPFPFAGYAEIAGVTACRIEWTDDERAANAARLARFLATLHRLPPDDAAPGDTLNRADLVKRAEAVKERLRAVAPERTDAVDWIDRLTETPPHAEPPRWVHGDLYARHLLADPATHRLCGVIDWGDLHIGDPALDLSIAFSFLPPDARPTFRDAYGPIDDATWNRARFRALHYAAILIQYGTAIGDDAIRRAGRTALDFATRL